MAEMPDMAKSQELLQSDEGQRAMREDGLNVETMRTLVEFSIIALQPVAADG